MNTRSLTMEATQTASNQGLSFQKLSILRTSLLFFIISLFSSGSFAQDQFLWTGDVNASWTNRANWDYYPYAGSTVVSPAPYYPGQGGLINPNGTRDDIAIFNDLHSVDCSIDRNSTGLTNAIRVGGIIVNGYTGTISQIDGNRFNVSDGADAGGGTGFWDGTTQIASTHPDLVDEAGTLAFRAYFDFDGVSSNGFQGGSTIVGGIVPSYGLLFAVPLTVIDGSTFKAPKDETRIRHNATFENGADFDNSFQGAVVLSNLSGGLGTRYYQFGGVHFWDLKVSTNGASPRTKEFSGGTCIVENDFMTTGLTGVLYGPSVPIIMNAPAGTEIHIKRNLIIGNIFNGPSYTNANAFGNIVLAMNGTAPNQIIEHSHDNLNFTGNLPALRINKPSGVVTLDGPVTVNKSIEFVSGIVQPTTPSTQNLLTDDVFVVNSNATVFGGTDASYCEGAIRVRTGKTIELPIGKANVYRPAIIRPVSGIAADNTTINTYSAEYFNAEAVESTSSVDNPPLKKVSNCEVWAIHKTNNTATDPWVFDLELSFEDFGATNRSCTKFLYKKPCKVAISRWDVSENQWVSHGNGGYFETTNASPILRDPTLRTDQSIVSSDFERSTSVNRPDLFTFGKLKKGVDCEDCEVELCSDYCVVDGVFTFNPNIVYGDGTTFNSISWDFGDGTSTDLNPSHTFSSTGIHCVTVTVNANSSGGTCSNTYTFHVYYNACSLLPAPEKSNKPAENGVTPKNIEEVKTIENANLFITPNPSTNGTVQVTVETTEKGTFDYVVVDNLGKNVLEGKINPEEKSFLDTSKLTAGSYIVTIQLANKQVSKKLVVVK